MIKFIKSLPLHFKSAFKSIKRRFGSALSSMFAVAVTLILIMLFLVVAFNVSGFTKNMEESVRIFVTIDEVVTPEDTTKLEKDIKDLKGVKAVEYSSKEDQFERFINSDQGGDDYEIFRTDNPLPAAFYVDVQEGKQIDNVTEQIKKMNGIREANYGGDSASTMIDAFNSIRLGGSAFVFALCVLAVFLISNTIKMNIHARREEIGIMRNVGASNLFIKTPFLIEGIVIGFGGSFVPILITCFGYNFLYKYMNGYFFTSMFKMLKPVPFAIYISLILLAVGVIVGLIGSFVSVNKYLKWKR